MPNGNRKRFHWWTGTDNCQRYLHQLWGRHCTWCYPCCYPSNQLHNCPGTDKQEPIKHTRQGLRPTDILVFVTDGWWFAFVSMNQILICDCGSTVADFNGGFSYLDLFREFDSKRNICLDFFFMFWSSIRMKNFMEEEFSDDHIMIVVGIIFFCKIFIYLMKFSWILYWFFHCFGEILSCHGFLMIFHNF